MRHKTVNNRLFNLLCITRNFMIRFCERIFFMKLIVY